MITVSTRLLILVSRCFEPSQPQRITSGLKKIVNMTISRAVSQDNSSYKFAIMDTSGTVSHDNSSYKIVNMTIPRAVSLDDSFYKLLTWTLQGQLVTITASTC